MDLGHSKLFIFIFVISNFKRFYEKRIILGTSHTWSASHLYHRPREPVYYIVDWRILIEAQMYDLLFETIWYFLSNNGQICHILCVKGAPSTQILFNAILINPKNACNVGTHSQK